MIEVTLLDLDLRFRPFSDRTEAHLTLKPYETIYITTKSNIYKTINFNE